MRKVGINLAGSMALAVCLGLGLLPGDLLAQNYDSPGLGAMPGEVAMSVIVADALTHAWDVAKGTGVNIEIPEELAGWALATWQQVVPPEGRGGGFAEVVPVGDDASAVDRLAGYTGRQP